MRIRFAALVVLLAVSSTTGCARLMSAQSRPTNQKAKKDCAACARMCEVAGEGEGKGGVDACKADCAATCEK
jgi:hypothetical protein